jgi:hypothetical protein
MKQKPSKTLNYEKAARSDLRLVQCAWRTGGATDNLFQQTTFFEMMRSGVGLLGLAGVAFAFPEMTVKEALPEFFDTTFPAGILGKWLPAAPPQSILGGSMTYCHDFFSPSNVC